MSIHLHVYIYIYSCIYAYIHAYMFIHILLTKNMSKTLKGKEDNECHLVEILTTTFPKLFLQQTFLKMPNQYSWE